MDTITLTDRYVAAAVRSVPENQREDLAAELRGSIADQIDARVEQGEAPDAAERAVLTDLGDPDKLAASYTDRPFWLIGPRYYFMWWRLLKLLLAIVPACAAFGVAIAQVLDGGSIGQVIGAMVPVTIQVIVNIAFWTTLVFAILERADGSSPLERTKLTKDGPWAPWTVDQLPEPKTRGAGFGDLIATLVLLGGVAGAVLWDYFIGFIPDLNEPLPFLHPDLWPWWIAALFVLLALEALLAVWVYARGRWDYVTATINVVLNILVVVPAVWLLSEGRAINPDFYETVIPANSADTVAVVMTTIFGFGIVGVAIWDSVDGYLKARRAR
ncbi:permease prefix domain 1-containing protein [Microbacterium lacus]|uniref:permease prefix domain 1-containing protein n=1 Tax=Microbacterium lacus TaxID=415217 RepID=UPI00384B8F62